MGERMSVKFLDRELGTASDWDGDPGANWWVNDFKPAEGIDLIECASLMFDEDKARIIAQDIEGNELKVWDIQWTFTLT